MAGQELQRRIHQRRYDRRRSDHGWVAGSDGSVSVPSVVGGAHGSPMLSPKQGAAERWTSLPMRGMGKLRAGIVCEFGRECLNEVDWGY
jgi:hypothetical protein